MLGVCVVILMVFWCDCDLCVVLMFVLMVVCVRVVESVNIVCVGVL